MSSQVYTYEYDQTYDPPMPIVEIGLTVLGRTDAETTVTALIDSGSDGTLIPIDILEAIGARYLDKARIRSILGNSQAVNLYLVSLRLGQQQIHAARVVAIAAGDEIILGRNVLNELVIILNGPASVTEIPI